MSDNFSRFSTAQRENIHADDVRRPIGGAGLAQLCYILVCAHVLFFGYIAIADLNIYIFLTWEDGWVENLTAAAFFLAGIALFVAALSERRLFPRCVYIIGAATLMFFTGEEISWGQRVIGFDTPNFLADLNEQEEVNIHNLYDVRVFIGQMRREALFALGIAGCAAFFCRNDRVFGIASPPILLTLSILVMLSYVYRGGSEFPYFLPLIMTWQRGLLLLLLLFALFSRNFKLSIAAAASMALNVAIAYLDYQHSYIAFWEVNEYLLGMISLFYALAALLDQETPRRKIAAAVAAFKPAAALPSTSPSPTHRGGIFSGIRGEGYLTAWTIVCALIIAGSVGLALRVYFDDRLDAAAFRETYSLTQALDPNARSNFDMYIDGRYLHYFKQPCDAADTEARFFLGVFPANVDDLRVIRRHYGFENLDFDFEPYGSIIEDACAARVRLPGYEIERVSTGQFIVEDEDYTNFWVAEFPVGGE